MTNEEFTKWTINNTFLKVLTAEMGYFDAMYIDPLVDKLCEQNMLYSKADKSNLKYDLKVAKEEIEKCKYSIKNRVLEAYGWDNHAVERMIIKYLPEELKNSLIKHGENEL